MSNLQIDSPDVTAKARLLGHDDTTEERSKGLSDGDQPTRGAPRPACPKPREILDRYRLLRIVGRGGMGVVYEAEDKESKERLAIKVLNPSTAAAHRRSRTEFRLVASISHRNLVDLYELQCDDEGTYILMEYIDGADVSAFADSLSSTSKTKHTEVSAVFMYLATSEADARPLLVDVCWTLALGYIFCGDMLLGALFQSKHTLLAFALREPSRVSRALGMEALVFASMHPQRGRVTRFLLERAANLYEGRTDHYVHGWLKYVEAQTAAYRCDWAACIKLGREAILFFRARCTGVCHEIASMQSTVLSALWYRCDVSEYKRLLAEFVEESRTRGELYAELSASSNGFWANLFDNDLAGAQELLARVHRQWPERGFHVHRTAAWYGEIEVELYQSNFARGLELANEMWNLLKRHELHRFQLLADAVLAARLRCSLGLWADGETSSVLKRSIRQDIGRLAKSKICFGRAASHYGRGLLALAEGRWAVAEKSLCVAAQSFENSELQLWSSAARVALARVQLRCWESPLTLAVNAELKSLGVEEPSRVISTYFPMSARAFHHRRERAVPSRGHRAK